MTTLISAVSVQLGDLRYDQHVTSLDAELGIIPHVNTVVCSFPIAVAIEATVGDDAIVSVDGGEGAATVVTGHVGAVRRGITRTDVTVVDGGAKLAQLRPAKTYEAQSIADIARSLADDAGVDAGRVDGGLYRLANYVAHQGRTAAEHVARLASLGGVIPFINADGELELVSRPLGIADRALLFGREFADYRVVDLAPPATPHAPIGRGSGGFVPSPDGLRETTDALTGSAADPGIDAWWRPQPVLRTPDTVAAAGLEAAAAAAAGSTRLDALCWLLPAVRPGELVEVQELPAAVPTGPWLIISARHRLVDGRGVTRLRAVAGGPALAGLLDGALGAPGGSL